MYFGATSFVYSPHYTLCVHPHVEQFARPIAITPSSPLPSITAGKQQHSLRHAMEISRQ